MDENQTDLTGTPAASAEPDAQPADSVDEVDSAALLAAIAAERDQLAKERAELYDRVLRTSAEFDNFRKRVTRERGELAEYAGMEIVRELLPVLDDLDRALKLETADREYAKGVELISGRMLDILKKAGLEPLNTEGVTFDPHVHHAVEMVPTEEAEDQAVLGEHQRGYNFKGRLLRPAMVKVAVRK